LKNGISASLDLLQLLCILLCVAALCQSWRHPSLQKKRNKKIANSPVEKEEWHSCLVSAGWLFWNIMANPPLGEVGSTSPLRWL
jgi:hypothetical protein